MTNTFILIKCKIKSMRNLGRNYDFIFKLFEYRLYVVQNYNVYIFF